MDLKIVDRLEHRLDRIETKLDAHLNLSGKNEADIAWLKGHVKIVTAIGITIISALIMVALGLK